MEERFSSLCHLGSSLSMDDTVVSRSHLFMELVDTGSCFSSKTVLVVVVVGNGVCFEGNVVFLRRELGSDAGTDAGNR